MSKVGRTIAAVALCAHFLMAGQSNAHASEIVEKIVEAPFADVRQDLGDAVVNRGYVIDYEAFLGDMLQRTSDDVGGTRKIYENAEFIQFCSAVLSREAMEADPQNIATCPYILFVYERADEKGKVRVGFRKIDETGSDASKKALAKINAVLTEMIEEAANQ